MEKLNLLKDNERKIFFHYLIPSICSTLVNSIYILVDTLIIGQGVGAEGISALNIFLPFFAIYNAIGLMFGLGGGILISVEEGMGNKEKSDKYFSASLISVVVVGIIFTLLSNIYLEEICIFLGANDYTIDLVVKYGRCISLFIPSFIATNFLSPIVRNKKSLEEICIFLGANDYTIDLVVKYGRCISLFIPSFIATNFLSPIVRNKKSPKLAMMSVLIGAGLNIVLDYIFVFPMNMGMVGAALATVIGSLTTAIVLLTHFIPKKNRITVSLKGISFDMIKRIVSCGISTFLMEVTTGFVIFIFNIQILKYIGDIGIVVFGIISNCAIVGTALFNGVAQASQPIIATNYGAKKDERVRKVLKYAMITTIIIGSVLFAVVFLFTEEVIHVFVKTTNYGAKKDERVRKVLKYAMITTIIIGSVLFAVVFLFTEEVIHVFVKTTDEIMIMGIPAIRLYLSAFCIMNINILLCNYFQSVGREKSSIYISAIRGFVLNIILVLGLPILFGGTSLWIVVPLTEMITFIGIIIYVKKTKIINTEKNTQLKKLSIS